MKLYERRAVNFFALESIWGVLHFLSLLETLCKSVSLWSAFPLREGKVGFGHTALQFNLLYNLK